MIDPATIHGKRIAMIAWGKKENGEDDVIVFTGVANWDGKTLTMTREPASSSYKLPTDLLAKIKPVQPEIKSILLEAEYAFSVRVNDLPDDADMSEFRKTGLQWLNDQTSSE